PPGGISRRGRASGSTTCATTSRTSGAPPFSGDEGGPGRGRATKGDPGEGGRLPRGDEDPADTRVGALGGGKSRGPAGQAGPTLVGFLRARRIVGCRYEEAASRKTCLGRQDQGQGVYQHHGRQGKGSWAGAGSSACCPFGGGGAEGLREE